MTKTMKEIVYDFIKNNGEVEFNKIWDEVESNQKEEWIQKYKPFEKSYDKIKEIKVGELYSLLTLEGTFTKKDEKIWVLTEDLSYDELMQSKISIVENND